MGLDKTLEERSKSHGDFTEVAQMAQTLKDTLRNGSSYGKLTVVQREGLEMAAHKMARIVCGDPHNLDHWLDLEGYARIVRIRMNR